ncbi:exopolysaccharide biosynthesis protein [Pseudoxanthobacter sp. M-2]|uniref:exopolysaccharide biosynthesis protein n=1 Tax=Pseudoxanthobacter sp. M-2 TaxID=3078754 RepID=UPI0038FD3213
MTSHEYTDGLAGAPPHEERRLSAILAALVADGTRTRIGIGELVGAMQGRAFGVLMFIFAIPNVLPTPPGVSSVLGAPLLLLSLQLALGRPAPWLPKFIARRSLPAAEFGAVVRRVVPWIARAERLLKPRLGTLARPPAERLIGFVCLLLAIVLFLPIPLGNMLPALAISIFSLAILERDGVAVLIGYVTAAVSVFVVAGVVYAMVVSAIFLLRHAVGWL